MKTIPVRPRSIDVTNAPITKQAPHSNILFRIVSKIYTLVKKVFYWLISTFYYMGFKKLPPQLVETRRRDILTKYQARIFSCKNSDEIDLDALYIPSPPEKHTGHALVICLNTPYQIHHPKNWEPFLKNGADIVLWNPSKLDPVSYSNDLSAILKQLRKKNPKQEIVIKTYCAGTDPGIKAAASYQRKKIHMIIDRGHGNVAGLARKFTVLAKLPPIQAVLNEKFKCEGTKLITKIGRVLFIAPKGVDQVMDYKGGNFTRDLLAKRPDQPFIEMENQDHWGKWDYTTYNQTLTFLAKLKVVRSNFEGTTSSEFPKPRQQSFFQRRCLPILIGSCC